MSDDHIGVKINCVLYVRLEDARKLREGWDKADERIAELEAALEKAADTLHDARCPEAWAAARAALEGKKDEA